MIVLYVSESLDIFSPPEGVNSLHCLMTIRSNYFHVLATKLIDSQCLLS